MSPPDSLKSASDTKPKGKLQRFWRVVRDSALENWPWLKPPYNLVKEGFFDMSRGWWTMTVLLMVLAGTITWWTTFSVMKKQIRASHEAKMAIKVDYESLYKEHYLDENALLTDISTAFDAGDYPYTVKFYERRVAIESTRNSIPFYPLYAAAKLAQDPTSGGRVAFEKNLEGRVADLGRQTTGATQIHAGKSVLGGIISSLNKIHGVVPESEYEFLNHIGDEVAQIRQTALE